MLGLAAVRGGGWRVLRARLLPGDAALVSGSAWQHAGPRENPLHHTSSACGSGSGLPQPLQSPQCLPAPHLQFQGMKTNLNGRPISIPGPQPHACHSSRRVWLTAQLTPGFLRGPPASSPSSTTLLLSLPKTLFLHLQNKDDNSISENSRWESLELDHGAWLPSRELRFLKNPDLTDSTLSIGMVPTVCGTKDRPLGRFPA